MEKSRMSKGKFTFPENAKLWIIFAVIAVIPLIVKEHSSSVNESDLPLYTEGKSFDFFLYWKSVAITICGFISTLLLIREHYKKKKNQMWQRTGEKSYLFIPLILYGILAVFSSIFSEYSFYSFHGIPEQYESLWVLLSYVIIACFSSRAVSCEEELKSVLKWLVIGIFGVLIISLSQFFECDIYTLIYPDYTFNFEKGRIYGPFYNPNYVGTYVTLVLPVTLMLSVSSPKRSGKIFFTIISVLLFVILIGSRSAAGFIITGLMLVFLLILNRKKILFRKKYFLICLFVFTIPLILFSGAIKENYIDKLYSSISKQERSQPDLEKIETNDDNIMIRYKGNDLYIQINVINKEYGETVFYIWDGKGKRIPLETDWDSGEITLADSRFYGITLTAVYIANLDNLLAFSVNIGDKAWNFTNQTDGSYYHITNTGKIDKISDSPSAVFTAYPHFASGRGYIWSKTIPLLKKTISLGTGADTFSLVYPNDDYVDNYNNGFEFIYVTRPHNMYLQIGVQTGVLSLVALVIFYAIYMISSLKLYWKPKIISFEGNVGMGIFVGTFGYMLVGLINDSTVTVAPVFWCLTGLGIGINMRMGNNSDALHFAKYNDNFHEALCITNIPDIMFNHKF